MTAMVNTSRDALDLAGWRPLAVLSAIQTSGGCIAEDLRNTEDRIPFIFYLANLTSLSAFGYKSDGMVLLGSPALGGVFGAGACAVVAPQRGPRGTLLVSADASTLNLSTALPASVATNQLANRGDGALRQDGTAKGYKVRVIGLTAGKVEERYVISNSSGTTPSLKLDTALSFTPAANDLYEFLSGRVYLLSAGVNATGQWKYYDILTNSFSTSLSVVNLPSTILTDSAMVALDESYCPNLPGEGFVLGAGAGGVAAHALVATAAAAGTITGQAASGDATVATNEYRNFQIRIVFDATNKTSVGQRRKITSHTAGASPVYTLASNWTVTPSATAQYVIENADEILMWGSASASTFCYAQDAIGAASADTWSTATYAARGNAVGAGVMAWHPFGMTLDAAKNQRFSFIYSFRGAGGSALDILDIAGGATGTWTNTAAYGGQGGTFNVGSCGCYDPSSAVGYFYLNMNASLVVHRFDTKNNCLEPWAALRFQQSAIQAGGRMATALFVDSTGTPKMAMPLLLRAASADLLQTAATR